LAVSARTGACQRRMNCLRLTDSAHPVLHSSLPLPQPSHPFSSPSSHPLPSHFRSLRSHTRYTLTLTPASSLTPLRSVARSLSEECARSSLFHAGHITVTRSLSHPLTPAQAPLRRASSQSS
jgi:hypothetical protein